MKSYSDFSSLFNAQSSTKQSVNIFNSDIWLNKLQKAFPNWDIEEYKGLYNMTFKDKTKLDKFYDEDGFLTRSAKKSPWGNSYIEYDDEGRPSYGDEFLIEEIQVIYDWESALGDENSIACQIKGGNDFSKKELARVSTKIDSADLKKIPYDELKDYVLDKGGFALLKKIISNLEQNL